jgi:hypothetical protein
MGREGGWGVIGVELIGQIRRAYFEQHRPIKENVRTLSVSRATVRKVICGQATAFKYERGIQPVPKLGEWVEVLTGAACAEAPEAGIAQRRCDPNRARAPTAARDTAQDHHP